MFRLFPSLTGPASPAGSSANFISGVGFGVAGGNNWLYGYWFWCCNTGQSTSPVKAALWSALSVNTGAVIPAATVTSGPLTAGAWTYIPLPAPVPLAPSLDPANSAHGSAYIAAIGVNGAFPDMPNYWGAGQPGATGITNGPLTAYSAQSASLPAPYGLPQGLFSTAGSDPATTMPNQQSSTDNFLVDVQVGPPPAVLPGPLRIWPSKADANNTTAGDTTTGDTIGTQVIVTQPVQLAEAWYFSPAGAARLASAASVFRVTGPDAGTQVAQIASPSWSGAAGSGWVKAVYPGGIILPPGSYVTCYTDAGGTGSCFAKDAGTDYFRSGAGANGINWGPFNVPQLSAAGQAYQYNAGGGANHPAFSDGTGATVPGQPLFAFGSQQPYLWAPVATPTAGSTQNYWADWGVNPIAAGSGLLMASYI